MTNSEMSDDNSSYIIETSKGKVNGDHILFGKRS